MRKSPLPSKDNLAILYGKVSIFEGELFGKHRHGEDYNFRV